MYDYLRWKFVCETASSMQCRTLDLEQTNSPNFVHHTQTSRLLNDLMLEALVDFIAWVGGQ